MVERLDAADEGAKLSPRRKISPVIRMMAAARGRPNVPCGTPSVSITGSATPLASPAAKGHRYRNGKAPQVRGFQGI